jgi:hypothetical protein
MGGTLAGLLSRSGRVVSRAIRYGLREPGAALLVLRMAAWVAALSLLVKLLPLPRIMRVMTPLTRRAPAPHPASTQEKIARLLDRLLALDILMFTPTCWKRAPVLYRYLALNGIESRIVFGVRKGDEGLLDGHAWLERGGEPLLEKTIPTYTVTFSFPA